jgi:hypothetical protein
MISSVTAVAWDDGAVQMTKLILVSLLKYATSRAKQSGSFRNNVEDPAWKNVFLFLSAIEVYFFLRPVPLSCKFGVHLNHSGSTDSTLIEGLSFPVSASFLIRLVLKDSPLPVCSRSCFPQRAATELA